MSCRCTPLQSPTAARVSCQLLHLATIGLAAGDLTACFYIFVNTIVIVVARGRGRPRSEGDAIHQFFWAPWPLWRKVPHCGRCVRAGIFIGVLGSTRAAAGQCAGAGERHRCARELSVVHVLPVRIASGARWVVVVVCVCVCVCVCACVGVWCVCACSYTRCASGKATVGKSRSKFSLDFLTLAIFQAQEVMFTPIS